MVALTLTGYATRSGYAGICVLSSWNTNPYTPISLQQRQIPLTHVPVIVQSENASISLQRLRSEIRSLEPHAVVDAMRPMRAVLEHELAPWRFRALLFSLLAMLALLVATIGLYALLAHQVADRTREIGIRRRDSFWYTFYT